MSRRSFTKNAEVLRTVRAALGVNDLLLRPEHTLPYECDGSTAYRSAPEAVALPRTTEQVAALVRACRASRTPFTARGAGTGLSGGATPLEGGLVISLAAMNRVLDVDPRERTARCQTGVVNLEISRAAAPHGLFFAPDPSSQSACTLGGNIAENSGGPHCFKLGATTSHILSATVVLEDGAVVELSEDGAAAGYDLLGLFTGSEGTLGIATEATVRLLPLPERVETLLAPFAALVPACEAVSAIVAAGVVPVAMEALDAATIEVVEAGVGAGYPKDAGAVLLLELDGTRPAVARQRREVVAILRAKGALEVITAKDDAERERLWLGRKRAFGAMGRISTDLYVQDGVVPRSALPEAIAEVERIGKKYRIRVANVFHAGDGNLHPCVAYDGRDPDERERVLAASHEMLEMCVRLGGTLSGEHGVGIEKRDALGILFGEADLETMRRVREAWSPSGLLNPGKVLPLRGGCAEASGPARSALPALSVVGRTPAVPGAWI